MSSIQTLKTAAVAAAVATILAGTLPVQAQDEKVDSQSQQQPVRKASKQENIGVVTGIAVGAVAGGPVGAILGAAAGGWVGNRLHREQESRHTLAAELASTEAERTRLAQEVSTLDGSLRAAQAESARMDGLVARAHDLATDVSFRTDDATLTPDCVARLQKLGGLAAGIPDVRIRVSGYADPRGTAEYNMTLSRQRAESVAEVLRKAGLSDQRLVVEAHGADESTSAPQDLDGYAFDRRVTVQLESASADVAQVK
jgi:outer membrane protein OmpA-like peptidoglycan-associated protein